jgi:hypothetical protein
METSSGMELKAELDALNIEWTETQQFEPTMDLWHALYAYKRAKLGVAEAYTALEFVNRVNYPKQKIRWEMEEKAVNNRAIAEKAEKDAWRHMLLLALGTEGLAARDAEEAEREKRMEAWHEDVDLDGSGYYYEDGPGYEE